MSAYDVGMLSSVQRSDCYCNLDNCNKIVHFILECKT